MVAPFVDKDGLIYVRLDETLSVLMRMLAKLDQATVRSYLRRATWLSENVPLEFFAVDNVKTQITQHNVE